MAKRRDEDVPALVLAIVAQVYERTRHRPQPWYIDRAQLELPHSADGVNAAIYYAEVSGWLVGAGEPPLGVSITSDGIQLLKDRQLI